MSISKIYIRSLLTLCMNRSALLAAGLIGAVGAVVAPRFDPTAQFSPLLVFLICAFGALCGLWIVSYALSLD